MKRFISKILIFFIPLILSILLWFIYYLHTYSKVNTKINTISGYEVLIMGDSQMQRINADYFNPQAYNFASSGEHFYFTYQKINKIIGLKKCNVKNIILGVSAHSFSPSYTRLFDFSSPEGQKSIKRYSYFIDWNEFLRNKGIPDIAMARNIMFGKPDWGGYYLSNNANPDTVMIRKTLEAHYAGRDKNYCSSQVKYLNEIVSLCNRNNINLFLVSTPYHPYYLRNVDDSYFRILKNTVSEYKGVSYINYLGKEINTGWMSDGNHLNEIGSQVYSKMINDTIKALTKVMVPEGN